MAAGSTPEVSTPVSTERQVVERAAEPIRLVREHGKEIKTARAMTETPMQQLSNAAGSRDEGRKMKCAPKGMLRLQDSHLSKRGRTQS